ncbi:hypothetical protein SO802_006266 [Lithocarpus litseifolius]|uniref:Uncharacterized protein n=1 Tax=Lithocarpus litseifolius TaxID=425828 RepID=A0AAW2DNE8_9ROSI
MDPDAMTTLIGDDICNIEEEEYWEACQYALKSPYELKANDEVEEGGTTPIDDEDGSDDKSDSSSDSNSSDNGHDDDDDDSSTNSESNSSGDYDTPYNGNDWGEPPSDREDEDSDLFYEEYDDDVDYYDKDIEDDVKANRWSDTNSMMNTPMSTFSDWSCITNISSRSGPQYDKHGREIPKLGSYYDSEPISPTPHTKEKDDIDAR